MTANAAGSQSADPQTLEVFYRDGLAVVPGVLTRDECAQLRDLTDRLALEPNAIANGHVTAVCNTMVLRYIQSLDAAFAALTVREPLYGYAQAIVGKSPKLCGMNVIRSMTNEAISRWHVDDILENPLAPGQSRFDPGMRMPVIWFTIQIALTDIDTYEQGPTEIVVGSHYSGRDVTRDDLVFDGHGPSAVYCKTGDAYLFNHQVWHRGAPNTSPDTRYLMQIQYCRASIHHRFSDQKNTLPPSEMPSDSPALRDVLGLPG